MKKLLSVLALGVLLGITPLAFSEVGAKKDCAFCELNAKGEKVCQKCEKMMGRDCDRCSGKHRGSDDKMALLGKLKHGPFINTAVLENLIESEIPLVILDARTGEGDDKTRIPGAKTLNDQSTEDQVQKIIKSKDTLIVTYCGNLECGASHKLYVHLKKLGYKNVVEYPFGIEGWLEAGNDLSSDR